MNWSFKSFSLIKSRVQNYVSTMLIVTSHVFVKIHLWVFILMLVITCYMTLWMLLKFLMSNSWRKSLRSFMRIWENSFFKRMIWLLSSMNPTNWLKSIKNLLNILVKSSKSLNVWIWTWMLNLFCLTKLLMILNMKMNLLRCMPSVWLQNLLPKRLKIFVVIMFWSPILCLMWVLSLKTNRCTYLWTQGVIF